jgi:hypothetical protein
MLNANKKLEKEIKELKEAALFASTERDLMHKEHSQMKAELLHLK